MTTNEDANLPGEMTTTITFTKVSVGTELNIVLALLKKLVEPQIPDQL